MRQWQAIKDEASAVIAAHGGTITHHHAVGRWHADAYRQQVPAAFQRGLAAAKAELDPTSLLNPGVLGLG